MIRLNSFVIAAAALGLLLASGNGYAQRGAPSPSPAPVTENKPCVLEKDANGAYCANKGCSGVCKADKRDKATKEILSCKCDGTPGCTYSIKDSKASCTGSCNATGVAFVKVPGSCQAIDDKAGRQKAGETGCICNPLKGDDDSGSPTPSSSPFGRVFGK